MGDGSGGKLQGAEEDKGELQRMRHDGGGFLYYDPHGEESWYLRPLDEGGR